MAEPKSSPGAASERDTRAKVSGAGDRHKRTATPRRWSDAYPNLRERDVLAAITDADLRHLARALDPGAFQGDHGPNGFTCPTCARWTAEVVSDVLWHCHPCGHTGTRYELAHRVACDGMASVQLARLAGVLR